MGRRGLTEVPEHLVTLGCKESPNYPQVQNYKSCRERKGPRALCPRAGGWWSSLEVRLGWGSWVMCGSKSGSLQPPLFKSGKPEAPKSLFMIHHLVLPLGNLRGAGVRWEEGGGVWKTNCSYTWGLWVLQAFEMEEKVIFNCKLVTGSLMPALWCQKTPQPAVTPRRTALGRAHAAARTVPPPRLL